MPDELTSPAVGYTICKAQQREDMLLIEYPNHGDTKIRAILFKNCLKLLAFEIHRLEMLYWNNPEQLEKEYQDAIKQPTNVWCSSIPENKSPAA